MANDKLTLAKRVAMLEQELAEIKSLVQAQAAKSGPAPAKAMAAAAAAATVVSPTPAPQTPTKPLEVKEEGISPEIMAVISAAVTHFLGLRARIRHARVVHPAGVSPWAQQGRVFVQASHVLVRR
jgi:hypothetical protein